MNQTVREDLERFRRERQELVALHSGADPAERENRRREEELERQRRTAFESLAQQRLEKKWINV